MTARAEYTNDEWLLLLTTPQAVAGAIAFSDGASIFEPIGEWVAGASALYEGPKRYPGNELVGALAGYRERVEPSQLPQPQSTDETSADVAGRLRQLAIDNCAKAAALLAERTTAAEAAGYASWVMDVARAAATARRHGSGLLRAGGPIVGPEERALLEELARTLGAEVGELPADDAPAPDERDRDAGAGGGAGASFGAFPAGGTRVPEPDAVKPPKNGDGPDIPSGPLNPS